MAAFGGVIGPEQDVEPEAPDPETFDPPAFAGAGDGYDWSRIRAS